MTIMCPISPYSDGVSRYKAVVDMCASGFTAQCLSRTVLGKGCFFLDLQLMREGCGPIDSRDVMSGVIGAPGAPGVSDSADQALVTSGHALPNWDSLTALTAVSVRHDKEVLHQVGDHVMRDIPRTLAELIANANTRQGNTRTSQGQYSSCSVSGVLDGTTGANHPQFVNDENHENTNNNNNGFINPYNIFSLYIAVSKSTAHNTSADVGNVGLPPLEYWQFVDRVNAVYDDTCNDKNNNLMVNTNDTDHTNNSKITNIVNDNYINFRKPPKPRVGDMFYFPPGACHPSKPRWRRATQTTNNISEPSNINNNSSNNNNTSIPEELDTRKVLGLHVPCLCLTPGLVSSVCILSRGDISRPADYADKWLVTKKYLGITSDAVSMGNTVSDSVSDPFAGVNRKRHKRPCALDKDTIQEHPYGYNSEESGPSGYTSEPHIVGSHVSSTGAQMANGDKQRGDIKRLRSSDEGKGVCREKRYGHARRFYSLKEWLFTKYPQMLFPKEVGPEIDNTTGHYQNIIQSTEKVSVDIEEKSPTRQWRQPFRVLDVAGGAGRLSAELAVGHVAPGSRHPSSPNSSGTCRGIDSTIVDPRAISTDHLLRTIAEVRERAGVRALCISRNISSNDTIAVTSNTFTDAKSDYGEARTSGYEGQEHADENTLEAHKKPSKAVRKALLLKRFGVPIPRPVGVIRAMFTPYGCRDTLGHEGDTSTKENENPCMLSTPAATPVYKTIVQLPLSSNGGYHLSNITETSNHTSNSTPAITAITKMVTLEDEVRACDLIIGLHCDGAVNAIMDAAIIYRKNFVIVPCCVFPSVYPRWLDSDQQEEENDNVKVLRDEMEQNDGHEAKGAPLNHEPPTVVRTPVMERTQLTLWVQQQCRKGIMVPKPCNNSTQSMSMEGPQQQKEYHMCRYPGTVSVEVIHGLTGANECVYGVLDEQEMM